MGRARYNLTLAFALASCFAVPITMINLGPESMLTRGAALALMSSAALLLHALLRRGWED